MPAVLVTGANRGIGLEFARQYAADGWDVIATGRQASAELDALGVKVERLDMRDLEAVAAFGDTVADGLDLLIANAGTNHPRSGETAADAAAWVNMMAVNSVAPFLLARAVLPKMRAPGGKLVAISSRMGSIADNRSSGWIPYRSSKAALNAAWRSLAMDVAPSGLVAVLYNPGWVQTRMGGPGAPLAVDESVAALRRHIAGLGPDDSGRFLERDGSEIPW